MTLTIDIKDDFFDEFLVLLEKEFRDDEISIVSYSNDGDIIDLKTPMNIAKFKIFIYELKNESI